MKLGLVIQTVPCRICGIMPAVESYVTFGLSIKCPSCGATTDQHGWAWPAIKEWNKMQKKGQMKKRNMIEERVHCEKMATRLEYLTGCAVLCFLAWGFFLGMYSVAIGLAHSIK